MKRKGLSIEQIVAEISPEVGIYMDQQVEMFSCLWEQTMARIEEVAGELTEGQREEAKKLLTGLFLGLTQSNIEFAYTDFDEE